MTEKKLVRDMTPEEFAVYKIERKAKQLADAIARRDHILPPMDREWNAADVCAYLNMPLGTLYSRTCAGTGPAPLKDGRRANYWWPPDVEAWRKSHQPDWVDLTTFRAS